ncbi:MAG: glycosyltransferase [Chloroflexi bacterium]|nr:glycosyltransferase [Chloroflexota bacterium]
MREDRPGLDWARNRGIESARHEIVAFTDDDARPAINWLRAIATAFAEPEVTAVTGPVAPSELNTPTQNLFEFGYGGMSHGFERRLFRRHQLSSNGLLWASGFGVGANMAFRRSVFKEIGLFDVALDVGTVSGGGGDIEMFHRLVAAEHTLMYDPSLLVWHQHRSEKRDMELLVKNNGRSFGCYLLTCRRNRTVSTSQIVRFAVHNWGIQWILKRLVRPEGFPRRSVLQEFVAFIGSPFAYIAAQRRANALRKIVSDQTVHELETAVPIKNHPTSTPHHHPG